MRGIRCSLLRKVGHRADRFRHDQDAVGVPEVLARQEGARHVDRDRHARHVVVDHVGVAEVALEDDRLVRRSGDDDLADLQRRVAEGRSDHDAVLLVRERVALDLAAAEAPVALVVLEDERNRLGDPRVHVEVPQQLLARDHALEREGIRDDVQRVVRVREEATPVHRLEPGLAARPLFGNDPGPCGHARRIFVDRHRDLCRERLQRGVVTVRQDVAGQLPQGIDDLPHRRVGRKGCGGSGPARARLLDRQRIARGALRREPGIPGQLPGRELEVGLRVHGDHLARADRRHAAHARFPRELFESLARGISVRGADADVVEPAFLALDAVLPDLSGEQLVEPPGNPANGLDVVPEDGLVQARPRGCRSFRRRDAAARECCPRRGRPRGCRSAALRRGARCRHSRRSDPTSEWRPAAAGGIQERP